MFPLKLKTEIWCRSTPRIFTFFLEFEIWVVYEFPCFLHGIWFFWVTISYIKLYFLYTLTRLWSYCNSLMSDIVLTFKFVNIWWIWILYWLLAAGCMFSHYSFNSPLICCYRCLDACKIQINFFSTNFWSFWFLFQGPGELEVF